MASRKPKNTTIETWPKIIQGTHLTVTKNEDGRVELVWDDEQLTKEVLAAIASVTKNTVGNNK